MTRLIDADKVIKEIENSIHYKFNEDDYDAGLRQGKERAIIFIENAPTVEEEGRECGEWIYKNFDEETGISNFYFCSRCKFPLTGVYKNYCAVCGAIMKK